MTPQTTPDSTSPPQHEVETPKPFFKNPFFIVTVIGILVLTLIRPFMSHVPAPPPSFGALPQFELIEQSGEPFSQKKIEGKTLIINLFFSRCGEVCEETFEAMQGLKKRYQDQGIDVQFLSISVDNKFDTPDTLKTFSTEKKLDQDWTLLTGSESEIKTFASNAFSPSLGLENTPNSPQELMSEFLVLVSPDGNIRGYYGTDEKSIDEIFHRTKHTLENL